MILRDLYDSGWCCEHGQETVGSLKRGDFFLFLCEWHVLKDSDP